MNNTNTPRRRWWLLAAIAVPALLLGAVGVTRAAHAFGPGLRDLDPARAQAIIGKRVDRLLDRVDATADQRNRIKAALQRAAPQMLAMRAEKEKLRAAMGKALAADRVDPNEIERLRRDTMKLAEQGSTLLSQTLIEVSQVLEVDQRLELMAMWQRRFGR